MIAVYGIICLPTRHLYVGQTTNVKSRWNWHRYDLRKGAHSCPRLQKAWKKFGEDMFRFFIIEQSTKAKVYERELWWIKKLEPFKPSKGFNRHWAEVKRNGFYKRGSSNTKK